MYITLEVSDFVNEGTPVPIPNTVVKLIYVDNTWLEAAREDRSSLTLKAVAQATAFFSLQSHQTERLF